MEEIHDGSGDYLGWVWEPHPGCWIGFRHHFYEVERFESRGEAVAWVEGQGLRD